MKASEVKRRGFANLVLGEHAVQCTVCGWARPLYWLQASYHYMGLGKMKELNPELTREACSRGIIKEHAHQRRKKQHEKRRRRTVS